MNNPNGNARIWLYMRNVGTSTCPDGSSPGLAVKAFQHWALKVDYMSKRDRTKVNKSVLYEANEDNGLVVATFVMLGEDEEDDWKSSPGFFQDNLGHSCVNEEAAAAFCERFNKHCIKYAAAQNDCQGFVNEFLADVVTTGAFELPPTAKEAKREMFKSTSNSSSNLLRNKGLEWLVKEAMKHVGTGKYDHLARQVMQEASFESIGRVSLIAGKPVQNFMKKEGIQLCLTAYGEFVEKVFNVAKGSLTPWNILQIAADIIIVYLLRSAHFGELSAYVGGKMASCSTNAAVGALVVGAEAVAACIALWIASEIVATLMKCFAQVVFGKSFTDIFGESQNAKLVHHIFNLFVTLIKTGANFGLKAFMASISASRAAVGIGVDVAKMGAKTGAELANAGTRAGIEVARTTATYVAESSERATSAALEYLSENAEKIFDLAIPVADRLGEELSRMSLNSNNVCVRVAGPSAAMSLKQGVRASRQRAKKTN